MIGFGARALMHIRKRLFSSQRKANRYRRPVWRGGHFVIAYFLATAMLMNSFSAIAQEELKDDRKIEERRDNNQTISEPTYRRLSAVHELLGEDDLIEALDGLARLEKLRLNKYEQALIHQTYGFVYARQDKQELAIASFEKSLGFNSLPSMAQQGMLYSLAGLYLAGEQYMKAIETMREWFLYEAEPAADAYMVIASGFTGLERFDDALPYVQKAIQASETPRENWYMLELAIHFEKERFREAAGVVKRMLQYWPDKAKYWEILFGAYLKLEEEKNALDVMMVAYNRNLVTTESKLLGLAQLNMALDIPFTAGSIIERGISEGIVESNKKNLDVLLQAWMAAKEYERAIATIDKIAPLNDDGEYYMRKARIYNELGEWQEVADSARQALDAGLEKPADAHMLAGMAYSELHRYTDSIAAFRRARDAGDARGRKNADAWIAFVEEKILLSNASVASSN